MLPRAEGRRFDIVVRLLDELRRNVDALASILLLDLAGDEDSNGGGHYHCQVRFAVETDRGRTTIVRSLHMVRDGEGWTVDSVE